MRVNDKRGTTIVYRFGDIDVSVIFYLNNKLYLKIPDIVVDTEKYNSYCFNDELFHELHFGDLVEPVMISVDVLRADTPLMLNTEDSAIFRNRGKE